MLVEEVEQELITLLVVGLDSRVLEVAASGHEAVDLVREPLNNVLGLDRLLPLLNIFLGLVLGGQHSERNLDARRVIGVNHGRVARSGGLESGALLRAQVDNLAAPAVSDNTPLFDAGALALDLLQDLGEALKGLGRRSLGREELAELLALVIGVRGVPGDVSGLAVEEVWYVMSATAQDEAFARGTSNLPGMNTWYWCSLSECARMSAPCRVCGKKPKMS